METPGNAGGGRPKQEIKNSVKAVFDYHGVKVLTDVMTDEDAKHSDKIRAAEVTAKIGGLQEPVAYDREVVDMLAATPARYCVGTASKTSTSCWRS